MADKVRTYLIGGKRYKANDRTAPAEVKAKIKAREAELGEPTQEPFLRAAELGPRYGEAPEDDGLPEDFPGLKALAQAGITSFTALSELEGDYTSVRGVGDTTAGEIDTYLQDRENQEA